MGLTVENTISLRDRVTNVIAKIRRSEQEMGNGAQRAGEQVSAGMNAGAVGVSRFAAVTARAQQIYNGMTDKSRANWTSALRQASREMGIVKDKTTQAKTAADNAGKSLGKWSNYLNSAKKGVGGVLSSIKNVGGAIVVVNQALQLMQQFAGGVKQFADVADSYASIEARLGNIVSASETVADLQERITAAAKDSRTTYLDMADNVAKMATMAGHAFKNNDEIIAFSSLINKALVNAGTAGAGAEAAIFQLTQGLASGVLRGDELNSVLEQATPIAQAIAKYMGLESVGGLKALAEQGLITADVVKNAMFAAADDINAKYEKMPVTFSQAWKMGVGAATDKLQPLFDKFSAWLTGGGAEKIGFVFEKIANAGLWAADVLGKAYGFVVNSANTAKDFITRNWDIIQPILIATAILFGILGAIAVGQAIATAAAWLISVWPLLLIIGVIALVIYWAMKAGATFQDVCGAIGGFIGVLYSVIYNAFANSYNTVAGFIEFFANVFNHPIYSIKKLFAGLAETILNTVDKIAKAIDKVFGTKLSKNISNIKDSINKWVGEMPEDYKTIARMELMDEQAAWDKGQQIGMNFGAGMEGMADKLTGITDQFKNMGAETAAKGAGVTIPEVDLAPGAKVGINGDVSISEEDLRYMRDIQRIKVVNKITSLKPTVTATFGDIRETADANQIMGVFADAIEEAYAATLR